MTAPATWGDFSRAEPDLAAWGRDLLYQFGVGLAFIATVRRDGGPRTHPIRVVIRDEGLYSFLLPSPKQRDLLRDGRYALHSYPCPDNEDAFYLIGRAALVEGRPELRRELALKFVSEMSVSFPIELLDGQFLFEHRIERCLQTRTKGHGDPEPVHKVWRCSQ